MAIAAIVLGLAAVGVKLSMLGSVQVGRSEFTEDYVAAESALHGGEGYADTQRLINRYLPQVTYERAPVVLRDPHTPAQIAIIAPLTAVPFRAARTIWMLVMAGCVAFAIALVCETMGRKRLQSVAIGIGLLATPIVQRELLYGNVTGLVLLLVVVGWRSLRRGREPHAGVALGVASAIKLFPALLAIVLIRERRWRAFGWQVAITASCSGASFLVPGLGIRAFLRSTRANVQFWRAAPMNVSLVGAPWRWLSQSFWRPDAANFPMLALGLSAVLFVLCVIALAVSQARLTRDVFLAAMPWMVLASILSWDRYLLFMIPTALAIVFRSMDEHAGRIGFGLLVSFAVVAIGQVPGLPGPSPPVSLVALVAGYGLTTYAVLLIGVRDVGFPRLGTDAALRQGSFSGVGVRL